jgi:demethylsterigmatocystin 6-O-methyltransferase
MNSPFQMAFNTEDPVFVYFSKHPETMGPFNEFMAYRRQGMPTWLSAFPSELVEKPQRGADDVLFVDMGGNIGHQCAELKAKYPHVQGRVVLQDLPYAIDMALKTEGVENTVHDIFTPQTVKSTFPSPNLPIQPIFLLLTNLIPHRCEVLLPSQRSP